MLERITIKNQLDCCSTKKFYTMTENAMKNNNINKNTQALNIIRTDFN